MKKAELILALLACAAVIMKLFHLQGAEVLIIVSLTPLAFLYFYLSAFLFTGVSLRQIFQPGSFKDIPRKQVIISVITGMALSVYIISFLFGILRMAGALNLGNVALGLLLLSLVLSIINALKDPAPFYNTIFLRLGLVAVLICVQLVI